MMHRPSSADILQGTQSYYSLVIGVAKRARMIAEESEERGDILIEKPVQLAVEEFARGDYKLIEREDIGKDLE